MGYSSDVKPPDDSTGSGSFYSGSELFRFLYERQKKTKTYLQKETLISPWFFLLKRLNPSAGVAPAKTDSSGLLWTDPTPVDAPAL